MLKAGGTVITSGYAIVKIVDAGDVINVARGECISINELIAKILEVTGSSSPVQHLSERPGDIRHSLADKQRLREQLLCPPNSDLDAGLNETVSYFADLFKEP